MEEGRRVGGLKGEGRRSKILKQRGRECENGMWRRRVFKLVRKGCESELAEGNKIQ